MRPPQIWTAWLWEERLSRASPQWPSSRRKPGSRRSVMAHRRDPGLRRGDDKADQCMKPSRSRSEEHTSELQSLMRISYAVFCLKKKKKQKHTTDKQHYMHLTKTYTLL